MIEDGTVRDTDGLHGAYLSRMYARISVALITGNGLRLEAWLALGRPIAVADDAALVDGGDWDEDGGVAASGSVAEVDVVGSAKVVDVDMAEDVEEFVIDEGLAVGASGGGLYEAHSHVLNRQSKQQYPSTTSRKPRNPRQIP
jgi:hypothetical protein